MMKNRKSAMSDNMNMKRSNRRGKYRAAGFTMAELLVVVAIIGILAGVSFIAVQSHQKSVTQLQYDTIAKEIYVAAQNHLTLAKSENYRQVSDLSIAKTAGFFGTAGNASADTGSTDIYYICSKDSPAPGALDQILPFGAIELVSGGNYIIRYQPNAARVLDVFYWTDGSSKYDANLGSGDYSTLVGSDDEEDKHKNYTGTGLLGWFGGEGIVETGEYLEAPEIEVINAEMLLVEVTDTNTDPSKEALEPKLKLIVEGTQSGAKVAIPLSAESSSSRVECDNVDGKYIVILDDITTNGLHFSDIGKDMTFTFLKEGNTTIEFIPGENITIQAVAYSDDQLTSVAYSGEWTTNSLYGEVTETTTGTGATATKKAETVYISNIRHLENLNDSISSVAYSDDYFNKAISAVQTVDLDWADFKAAINTRKGDAANTAINIYDKDEGKTKDNCFLPVTVSNEYALTYDGQSSSSTTTGTGDAAVTTTVVENHSIAGIVVDDTEATGSGYSSLTSAGLFGSLTGATIKNLELKDCSITLTSDGDVGILAGALTGCTVENVIAYNTTDATAKNVNAASGSAGGLIGSVAGTTSVTKSAAALIVESTGGNAGGLIGTAAGGTVSGCYSGGHTIDSTISDAVIYDDTDFNVTATASGSTGGIAGGLIGDAGTAVISNSYSTCSVFGKYAGGFVGTGASGGSATNCYATGLVLGGDTTKTTVTDGGTTTEKITVTEKLDQEGAFAYSFSGTVSNCKYFEIINEREEKDASGEATGGYTYLPPVSGSETVTGLKALDETAAAFNDFVGSTWENAAPYNPTLTTYYGGKYILPTVSQLGATLKTSDTDTTDYFVATHYGDWPAPEIFVINTK